MYLRVLIVYLSLHWWWAGCQSVPWGYQRQETCRDQNKTDVHPRRHDSASLNSYIYQGDEGGRSTSDNVRSRVHYSKSVHMVSIPTIGWCRQSAVNMFSRYLTWSIHVSLAEWTLLPYCSLFCSLQYSLLITYVQMAGIETTWELHTCKPRKPPCPNLVEMEFKMFHRWTRLMCILEQACPKGSKVK